MEITTATSNTYEVNDTIVQVRKFEVLEEIGKGCKAKVYKAKDAHGRIVALKCFFDKTEVEGASFEVEIGKKLSHPHIIKIFDSFLDENNTHTLVLEFVDGKKMEGFDNIEPKSRLQLLDTLIYVHDQGFLHEDLYSDNFIVEEGNLKMIDLGSLTLIEDGCLTLKEYAKDLAAFANIDKSHFSHLPKDDMTKENLENLQEILRELYLQFKTEFQQVAHKTQYGL